MKRWLILGYGLFAYTFFLAVFMYAVGFLGNFLVPTRLDGEATMDLLPALAINLGLLGLFAVQHSLMARPVFKKWLTRWVPQSAERSTYVMASNLAMVAVFAGWQPLGISIWEVTQPVAAAAIYGVFFLGWATVFLSTCLISHFDLFGLRQVWLQWQGKPYESLRFNTPLFYQWVRHPLYVGWLMAIWATPTMGAGHLLFAVGTTVYILTAIQLEENDLVDAHGVAYRAYQNRVPMLIPRLWSRRQPAASVEANG